MIASLLYPQVKASRANEFMIMNPPTETSVAPDMSVPGVPGADLVVVETDFVLGRSETFLDGPAPGHRRRPPSTTALDHERLHAEVASDVGSAGLGLVSAAPG